LQLALLQRQSQQQQQRNSNLAAPQPAAVQHHLPHMRTSVEVLAACAPVNGWPTGDELRDRFSKSALPPVPCQLHSELQSLREHLDHQWSGMREEQLSSQQAMSSWQQLVSEQLHTLMLRSVEVSKVLHHMQGQLKRFDDTDHLLIPPCKGSLNSSDIPNCDDDMVCFRVGQQQQHQQRQQRWQQQQREGHSSDPVSALRRPLPLSTSISVHSASTRASHVHMDTSCEARLMAIQYWQEKLTGEMAQFFAHQHESISSLRETFSAILCKEDQIMKHGTENMFSARSSRGQETEVMSSGEDQLPSRSSPPIGGCCNQPKSRRMIDIRGYLQLRGWGTSQQGTEVNTFESEEQMTTSNASAERCLRWVEYISYPLVVLNVLFMGVSLQVSLKQRVEVKHMGPDYMWIWYIDAAFAACFGLEMMLRLVLQRRELFTSRTHRSWNLFDMFILAIQVFDVWARVYVNLAFLRIVKLVRVLRVGRLFRIVPAARRLRLTLSCLCSIGRPLLWTFAFFVVGLYLFSLMLLQIVEFHTFGMEMEGFKPWERHFGGVVETMWTLGLASCGHLPVNEFWGPFDNISKWTRVFLLIFVGLFVFGFFNIITAIFVDGVIFFSTIERDWNIHETMAREHSPLQQLKTVLLCSERVRDGFLGLKSLQREIHQNDEVIRLLAKLRIQADQVEGLATLLDRNDDDCISIEELILSIMQLHGSPNHVATMLYDTKQSAARLNNLIHPIHERIDKLLFELRVGRSVSGETI